MTDAATPRLLIALPQLPHDPASGAARSISLIGELLQQQGYAVRLLGTTASELGSAHDPMQVIHGGGGRVLGRRGDTLRCDFHGVEAALLDVGRCDPEAWRRHHVAAYDRLLDEAVDDFRPDVVLTYGGHRDDVARHKRLRQRGIKLVLGLRNLGYLGAPRDFFDRFDLILTPSRFITELYGGRCGIASTPMPTPMRLSEVVPPEHDPVFFTFVNPTWPKGLGLAARLAAMIGQRRPDIPLLFVESRGNAGDLTAAAAAEGIDLAGFGNLMFTPTVSAPREFLKVTRALLVPSLWSEPSGRVACEALVAGIPPIVSDRGGLPETVGSGGIVLPVADHIRSEGRRLVSEADAEPWFRAIARLADDDDAYERARSRAGREATRYDPRRLGSAYGELLEKLLA